MSDSSSSEVVSEVFNVASSAASSSERAQAVEFNLSDYQWQHRVALIFAPSERSPAYQQQMQAWQAEAEGMQDRDLKVVEILVGESRADRQIITAASANRLRQQFGVTTEDFAVILVGKDGTEKQRSQAPVDPTVLFRTIDAMPMRQQEMRSRQ
ncbi:MAG TPA: DUF4174 domain-containing protein [Thermosynechococcaceae cyanobacterium]